MLNIDYLNLKRTFSSVVTVASEATLSEVKVAFINLYLTAKFTYF